MKRQEFLNEIGKRFKYVYFFVNTAQRFDNLAMDRIIVAMIGYGQVYQDTISFWVQNEGKSNEEILDVRWEGSYFKIDTEIENILIGKNIYQRNERHERKKQKRRKVDEKKEN